MRIYFTALTSLLWGEHLNTEIKKWQILCRDEQDTQRLRSFCFRKEIPEYLNENIARTIANSAVIPLLAMVKTIIAMYYCIKFIKHLNNDSVFDISQRLDFYQVKFYLIQACLFWPNSLKVPGNYRIDCGSLPFSIILTQHGNSEEWRCSFNCQRIRLFLYRSLNKCGNIYLVPRFRDTLNAYPLLIQGRASPDLAFIEFIRHMNALSEVIIRLIETKTFLPFSTFFLVFLATMS